MIRQNPDEAQGPGSSVPHPSTRHSKVFSAARERITGEIDVTLRMVDPDQAALLIDELLAARRIATLGAGRSKLAVDSFAMRLMHMGFQAYVAQAVTTPAMGPGDLLVTCSGSGATPSVTSIARNASAAGCRVASVTSDPRSELAAISDTVVGLTEYGTDRSPRSSTQFVGTLFEQSAYLFFDCVVIALESSGTATQEEMLRRHTNLE